jgi:hypothetical protein
MYIHRSSTAPVTTFTCIVCKSYIPYTLDRTSVTLISKLVLLGDGHMVIALDFVCKVSSTHN